MPRPGFWGPAISVHQQPGSWETGQCPQLAAILGIQSPLEEVAPGLVGSLHCLLLCSSPFHQISLSLFYLLSLPIGWSVFQLSLFRAHLPGPCAPLSLPSSLHGQVLHCLPGLCVLVGLHLPALSAAFLLLVTPREASAPLAPSANAPVLLPAQ